MCVYVDGKVRINVCINNKAESKNNCEDMKNVANQSSDRFTFQ